MAARGVVQHVRAYALWEQYVAGTITHPQLLDILDQEKGRDEESQNLAINGHLTLLCPVAYWNTQLKNRAFLNSLFDAVRTYAGVQFSAATCHDAAENCTPARWCSISLLLCQPPLSIIATAI